MTATTTTTYRIEGMNYSLSYYCILGGFASAQEAIDKYNERPHFYRDRAQSGTCRVAEEQTGRVVAGVASHWARMAAC